jgi:hypothetical protein
MKRQQARSKVSTGVLGAIFIGVGGVTAATSAIADCDDTNQLDCGATIFDLSVASLHQFDATIQSIRSDGALNWARGQIAKYLNEAGRSAIASLSPTADKVLGAGTSQYQIASAATATLQAEMNAPDSATATAEVDNLYSYLGREKVPEMLRNMQPQSVRALEARLDAVVDDAQFLSDKTQAYFGTVSQRIGTYFSSDGKYGLEPGGADLRAVEVAAPALAETLAVKAKEIASSLGQVSFDPSSLASRPVKAGSDNGATDLAAELGIQMAPNASNTKGDSTQLADSLSLGSPGNANGQTDWTAEAAQTDAETSAWQRQKAAIAAENQRQLLLAQQEAQRHEQERQQRELQAAQTYIQQQRTAQTPEDDATYQAPAMPRQGSSGSLSNILTQGLSVYQQMQAAKNASRAAPHTTAPRQANLNTWIPAGWAVCNCPTKHQVQWINGLPYHGPGPVCPK